MPTYMPQQHFMQEAALPAFDLEGHRGSRGLMPENTIPAMLKALEFGVTTLEMDVHVSRDGMVLLSHDAYLNPAHDLLPNGNELLVKDQKQYALYQMDYATIREVETGSKHYAAFPEQQKLKTYKPLLAEVLDAVQAYLRQHQLPQVFYNIETKSKRRTDGHLHPGPEEFVTRLMQVVLEKKLPEWVIIQSFDVRTLQVLHKSYPAIKTSLLIENRAGFTTNIRKLGFTPTIYSPHYKLVTKRLIRTCCQKGIKVIPWTVNGLHEMKQLKQMGVDGIISDYPNLFRNLSE